MLGWRRIFFLDDDIQGYQLSDLQSTVSMLGSCPSAGMRVSSFPDNSAVCHAHRATGGLQDVFITGAALAVDCQQNTGFFPHIYNEDWLFFYEDASTGRLGSSGGKVTQLRYDPFADAQRAAWQEFGDVLAEGLYALLDHGMDCRVRDKRILALFPRRQAKVSRSNHPPLRHGEAGDKRTAAGLGRGRTEMLDSDWARIARALCLAVAAGPS